MKSKIYLLPLLLLAYFTATAQTKTVKRNLFLVAKKLAIPAHTENAPMLVTHASERLEVAAGDRLTISATTEAPQKTRWLKKIFTGAAASAAAWQTNNAVAGKSPAAGKTAAPAIAFGAGILLPTSGKQKPKAEGESYVVIDYYDKTGKHLSSQMLEAKRKKIRLKQVVLLPLAVPPMPLKRWCLQRWKWRWCKKGSLVVVVQKIPWKESAWK